MLLLLSFIINHYYLYRLIFIGIMPQDYVANALKKLIQQKIWTHNHKK